MISMLSILLGVVLGLFLAAGASDVDIESTDPSLVYNPSPDAWPQFENPGPGWDKASSDDYYHQGGYRSTNEPGAAHAKEGSYVAYYSDLYHTHGLMEINLDGKRIRITTHSNLSYGTPQQKLFGADVDPNMPNHVITLTNLENKTMGLDYLLYTAVFPADIPAAPSTSTVFPSISETSASGGDHGGTKTSPNAPIPSTRPPISTNPSFIPETSASSRQPGGADLGPSDSTPSTRPPTGGPTAGARTTGEPNAGPRTPVKIAVVIGVTLAIAFVVAIGIGLFALWRRRIQRKGSAPLDPASPTPFHAQTDPAASYADTKDMSRLLDDEKMVRPFFVPQPDPEESVGLPSQRMDKLKAASPPPPLLPENAEPGGEYGVAPMEMALLQAQLERLTAENAMLRHVAEPPAYSDGSARSERGDREM